MIRKLLRRNKIKNANFFVEPDEIFLDSKNLENFDQQQFEGRIEKPISKKNILFLIIFFLIFIITFGTRLSYLSLVKGEAYLKRSQSNTLQKAVIFADRGIIYDRNNVELAWNEKTADGSNQAIENQGVVPLRSYMSPGFSHVLGYVSYPAKDKSGFYWQTEFIGKDGLEKQYNDILKGENGLRIVETDAHNEIHSEN
ncbi:MAG: hypothetical protein KBC44_01315, partial [Candidatus Pacebacteria bacterium]|nr:hypothetical protein [Candidatus Paceibacterota bacterium]